VERIHDIRRRSKILVALGACAVQGGVNAMKNLHPAEWVKETVYGKDKYLFPSMPAQPVGAVVKVDYEVRGCPMSTPEFLHLLKSLVMGRKPETKDYAVCVECKLKENECVLDKGMFCLGPVTRAGCGALCPEFGQYCTGCRGMVSNANQNGAVDMLKKHGLSAREAIKRMDMFCSFQVDRETIGGNNG
jgi:coenzyme F420-reducing hydrogenase gamma subunit